MKRALAGAAAAATLLLAGAAQAALQSRDLNGDTVVDAFYDTDLDITWLRNANVNGPMDWAAAVAWADGYSFGGYSDWRLPASDTCVNFNCTGSEMGHLWYVELGNSVGIVTNTGEFENLKASNYWSGREFPSDLAWFFDATGGFQGADGKSITNYAMAVRTGDVPTAPPGAVPEPQTYALVLLGFTGLALTRRRPQR
jgi:hypothetical protein